MTDPKIPPKAPIPPPPVVRPSPGPRPDGAAPPAPPVPTAAPAGPATAPAGPVTGPAPPPIRTPAGSPNAVPEEWAVLPGDHRYQPLPGYPIRIGPDLLLHEPGLVEKGQPRAEWPAWDSQKYPPDNQSTELLRMPADYLKRRGVKL